MKRLSLWLLCLVCLLPGLSAQAVQQLIKSGATDAIPVFVTDNTGAPVTTAIAGDFTLTVRRPGATAYVAALGTISPIGNGVYDYTPTSTETTIAASRNTLLIHAVVTATATSFGDSSAQIVAFDPTSATNLGLSALPTASPNATNGMLTVGTGAGQINPTSGKVPATLATGDNGDKLGYSLSQTFPANFALLGINGTGQFTAPTLALAPTGSGSLTTNQGAALDRVFAMTNVSNQFTVGAFSLFPFPSDYLTTGQNTKLTAASTAQQTGTAVTLPSTVLQAGDLTALSNRPIYGNLTEKQVLALILALLSDADRTYNANTHTAVSTWYARKMDGTLDKTKPVVVKTTVYDSTDKQIVSSNTVLTPGNLY